MASQATLFLRVEPQTGAPFRYQATGDEVVLGRSSKAHVAIPDPFLSRQHARLFRREGVWYVEDLGGRNRTLVNGRVVESAQPVKPGDVLSLSSNRVVIEAGGGERAAVLSEVPQGSEATLFRPVSVLLEDPTSVPAGADASGLRRHTERLRALNAFHRALAQPISVPDLLEMALDRAFADLRPEEGVLFLKRPDGELEQAARRKLPGTPAEFLFSRSLAREVTEKGLAALVTDASSDARFAAAESILSSGVRSLVAAPLLLDSETCLGMIVLSSRAHLRSFSEADMEELVFLASAAALRLHNLALAEEAAQRRLLEKELDLARRIQVALLPESLPRLPGFELCASNVPSRRVSGDLYVIQTRRDESECVVLLADVAGKGISAALLTASLEALSAGPIEVGHPADEICARLSRRLHARTSGERYATAFVLVLHLDGARVCWTNAGHNPAVVVRRDGRVEELKATGLPLGLLPGGDYTRGELVLGPGDLLAAYTDGITEAANPEGDEFGLERLVAVCREQAAQGAEAVSRAIGLSLDAFTRGVPFGDDRTLVLLRRSDTPGA